MLKVCVIGGTGYAGIELIRLLNAHPQVELYHLVSNSMAGKNLSEVYPNFKECLKASYEQLNMDKIQQCDIIFTALPHGVSSEIVPKLYNMGKTIIDLSGDFRYNDPQVYKVWYGKEHKAPDILKQAVYGLPELHREEIKNARLVGNPGCYTTGSILALAPLLKNNIIDHNSIIIDAKSGTTGAGRGLSLGLHFSECSQNIKAYSVAVHRHTSEIEQELSLTAQTQVKVSFTPHLIPVKRGILVTAYGNLYCEMEWHRIFEMYAHFYKDAPFVRLYKEGDLPETKHVSGSNFCDIGIVVDKRVNRIIIITALDNIVKGAGGQAIQNMNLMLGLEETTGLMFPGYYL